MFSKVLLVLLLAAGLAAAASPKIGCVAEVGNPADGNRHWVLVFLKFIDGAEPHDAYRIYAKTGQANSPAPYALLATVQSTSDPATLGHLLQQAEATGVDVDAFGARLGEITADALPGASIAEMLSLFVGSKSDTGVIEFQRDTMANAHPVVAAALGRAAFVRVPSNTPTTFEVRAFAPGTLAEGAVVGRATVGTGPAFLDAPSGLREKVEESPKGDLRVQLQWCYPQPLREKFLHWAGAKVFRANRQAWIDAFGAPPPLGIGRAALLAAVASGHVTVVNGLPVFPEVTPTCPLEPDFETPMFTDDNDSAAGGFSAEEGGQAFVAGDRYIYWIAECDVLGRPGQPSHGLDVTICDRIAPRPPVGLTATNGRVFEGGSAEDFLRLEWPAAPPSEVRRWYLYRSVEYDQVLKDFLLDPTPATASLLAIVPNDGSFEAPDGRVRFDHRAGGALPLPAPGDTVYYRLRAEDDTPCKDAFGRGNISGPGGPVPASIHDLEGPSGMGGRIDLACCEVATSYQLAPGVAGTPFTARLRALRPNNQWLWVEFRSQGPNRFLGRYHFAADQSELTATFQPGEASAPLFGARFGHVGGRVGEWQNAAAADILPYNTHIFSPRWECDGTTMDAKDCPDFHPPLHPETGEVNELCLTFNAHADIASWIVFRQLGPNGTKTKIASANVDAPGPVTVCDGAFPPRGGELCYYIQGFDAGGNPGPMEPVGCVKVAPLDGLPVPTITETAPVAGDSDAQHLQWFCPPGAERFDLAFSPPPPNAEATFLMFEPGGALREFGTFETARVPTAFGAGAPAFADVATLIRGVGYTFMVRAAAGFGEGRDTGAWSKPTTLQWLQHTNPVPEVPWPMRDTPNLSGTVHAEWDTEESLIRVALGQIPQTSLGASLPVDSVDAYLYHDLPLVAYLHQASPGGRGTMLQTTHRLDRILTEPVQGGGGLVVIDESIKLASNPVTLGDIFPRIWLLIDQPVLSGRRYAVTLVFHGSDGEVREVLRSNEVQIPILLETGN